MQHFRPDCLYAQMFCGQTQYRQYTAAFGILPACLVVNVRAETPSPMSSLFDSISSAFQEWRECLLEWRVDLNNEIKYEKYVLFAIIALSHCTCSLGNVGSLGLFVEPLPKIATVQSSVSNCNYTQEAYQAFSGR